MTTKITSTGSTVATTATATKLSTSRRSFLKSSAAFSGGLRVGFTLPMGGPAQAAGTLRTPSA